MDLALAGSEVGLYSWVLKDEAASGLFQKFVAGLALFDFAIGTLRDF